MILGGNFLMARGFSHGGSSGGGGGGGRSFGGGGFSFGGGGFSFGSSSSRSSRRDRYDDHYHHRPPRRPWRVSMFGRTVVITTGMRSFFLFGLIALFFFGFVFITNVRGLRYYKEDIAESEAMIQKYEDYSVTFLDIINKAESGNYANYKIVEGTFDASRQISNYGSDPTIPGVYKSLYYNGAYHYFIVYTYTSVDGTTQTDSTFTQYLIQDVQGGTDEKIDIACAKIGHEYWAINTDYTLEKNIDYQKEKQYLKSCESSYKSAVKTVVVYAVVFAVILGIIIAVAVYKIKRAKKKNELEDAKKEAEIAEAQAKAETAQKVADQTGRVCKYCGMDVPDGADCCPGCGARDYE